MRKLLIFKSRLKINCIRSGIAEQFIKSWFPQMLKSFNSVSVDYITFHANNYSIIILNKLLLLSLEIKMALFPVNNK